MAKETVEPGTLRVGAGEAAGMLGTSQRAVRKLVASGMLEAESDGEGAAGRVLISVSSVKKLRSERRSAG